MGAGASAAFPEQLNEEQVKIISSYQFQESMFISLQDPDGTVPKDLFVKCFEEGPEREVLYWMMCGIYSIYELIAVVTSFLCMHHSC